MLCRRRQGLRALVAVDSKWKQKCSTGVLSALWGKVLHEATLQIQQSKREEEGPGLK